MEGRDGKQGPEGEHEEDEIHGIRPWVGSSQRHWSAPMCSLPEWGWGQLHSVFPVQTLGTQELQRHHRTTNRQSIVRVPQMQRPG